MGKERFVLWGICLCYGGNFVSKMFVAKMFGKCCCNGGEGLCYGGYACVVGGNVCEENVFGKIFVLWAKYFWGKCLCRGESVCGVGKSRGGNLWRSGFDFGARDKDKRVFNNNDNMK